MRYIGDFFEVGIRAPVPFPRAPATSESSDRQSMRVRVERANPGSLGRPSRVAACARSSGFTPFCTILHWGSRRYARDRNFGRGFWSRILLSELQKANNFFAFL